MILKIQRHYGREHSSHKNIPAEEVAYIHVMALGMGINYSRDVGELRRVVNRVWHRGGEKVSDEQVRALLRHLNQKNLHLEDFDMAFCKNR